MSIQQLSVFTQSKPGHLGRILGVFAKNDVNVRGFSCSDSGDFGIARFVVDDPAKASAVLTEEGFASALTPIVCFELPDQPGALESVVEVMANAGFNILYCYSLISTFAALRVAEVEQAEELLAAKGIRLLTQDELA